MKTIEKIEKILNWCLVILIVILFFGLNKQIINQELRIIELENHDYTMYAPTIYNTTIHNQTFIKNPFNDSKINNSLLDLQGQIDILKQNIKNLREYNLISENKEAEPEQEQEKDWRIRI